MDLATIAKAICCPNGTCLHPEGCCLLDKSRMFPVNLWESAQAIQAMHPAPTTPCGSPLRDGDHPV